MGKTNKKHLLFIISSIAIIISSAFIIITLFLNIKSTSDKYLDEKKELEKISSYSKDLEDEDHSEIKNKLKKVNELFVNPDRPIEEILFLEEAAKNTNLDANIEAGEKINDSEHWKSLEFNVEVSGSFSDFISFIKEVKIKKWIYSIKSLSIETKDSEENKKRDISATLLLRAYYLDN